MGSSLLVCPMCCGETFNSSQSLKYHLLSMTDNLYCPGCSQRSESVAALIQHLDSCGSGDNVTFEETVSEEKVEEGEVLMDTNVEQIHESFFASVSNEGIMIVGGPRSLEVDDDGQIKVVQKIDVEDQAESILPDDEYEELENIDEDATIRSSLVKKDSTENAPRISIPETPEDTNDANKVIEIYPVATTEYLEDEQTLIEMNQDENTKGLGEELMRIDASALYSCSSCGMGFNSVLDHIKQYHDGQEVVLEMADDAPGLEEENAPLEEPVAKTRQRQKMNTIKTEECVDSEGRLYTRKVVQIEPFWDKSNNQSQSDNSKTTPMIENFFYNTEGVKPRQKSELAAPPKVHRCNQCLEEFPRLADFRTHVCLNGSNHCDICDQSFATVKALQIHSKIHEVESSDPLQFVCAICGTQFSSHKSLRLHSRMHAPVRERHVEAPEGDPDATFTCLDCGKSFSESYRSAHMALHTGDSVTCTICNRKFDSADSLAMHAAVHPELGASEPPRNQGRKPWKRAKPPSPEEGEKQMEKEGSEAPKGSDKDCGDLSKPYQCQHCGRRFTRPHEKVKHERIHTGEKPHACEVCGKTFRVSYCLTLHMRTHTGVRPYECKHCGKRFKASSVYNHHLLTHGDERAYKCPFCVKTFKTRVQLAGHKNSHTKPFRCTECSRPFASLYAARAHIATHKKDNNLKFSCYICGASYGRAFALNDHMKVHGSEAVATPEPAREEIIHEDFLLEEDITEQELGDTITPNLHLSENGIIKKFVDSD